MTVDERYERLEATVQALTQRVHRLESRVFPTAKPAAAAASAPSRPRPPQSRDMAPARPRVLLTPSRVLAAVGALVLLLGTGYLLRFAVVQGWLGPEVRVLLALCGSAALAAVGVRLERSDATRVVGQVCTATGSVGAYAAVVAAAAGYRLVPAGVGFAAAAAVALAAAGRGAWARSQGVAALGVGGALATPLLVRADEAGATLAFLVIVLTAGLSIAVRLRWPAVTALAFVLATPQVWAVAGRETSTAVLLALAAVIGLLFLVAVAAHARGTDWATSVVPALLAVLNAGSVAAVGHLALREAFAASAAPAAAWLAGVAVVHAASGVWVSRRFSAPPIGVVLLTVGVLTGDAAVLAWTGDYVAAAALGVIALAAAAATPVPWLRLPAAAALTAQLAVVLLHAGSVVVPRAGAGSAEALLLVAAASAFAVLIGVVARPGGTVLAVGAASTYLGTAVLRLLHTEAPLSALLHGPGNLPAALLMCAAIAASALLLGQLLHRRFTVAAVAAVNYALSLAAVAMDPDGAGRVALTALWSVGGGLALVGGRVWQRPDVRRGGGALLAAAVAKAALVDTVLLQGTNRAVALLLCGTVLVATAVAEARAADGGLTGRP